MQARINFRKAFAALVCVSVLGAQAYAILPPLKNSGWYWPFLDYPMYSGAWQRGDVFAIHQLRGVPCDGSSTRALGYIALGVPKFTLYKLTEGAAAQVSDDPKLRRGRPPEATEYATGQIDQLIRTRIRPPVCRVQLWERAYAIGGKTPYSEVEWTLLREWNPAERLSRSNTPHGERR